MKKNDLIYRSIGTFDEIQDEESRVISGRAIVFDSYSRDLGGFIERVEPTAISEDFLASQDVTMNLDHDNSRLLARYNRGEGTLSLELREDGLHFSFEAPRTALGDEVLWNVRHGNLYECSFACLIDKKNGIRRYQENGQEIHVIERLNALLDCSIVCRAAYPDTEVSARNAELAAEEAEIAEQERLAAEAAENERKSQIINSLDEKLSDFYKNI